MATKQGVLPFKPEKFYSIPEAAAYLHVAVSTMYKIARDRQIRFIKTGKEIMFRKEYLDEYLESRVFEIVPPDQGMSGHVG
ncbi:MAG: helix-turn-helix domain-containing protein [Actinomycetota bacterium]